MTRLTLRAIVRDLSERFLNLESGWLRTFKELFTGPGGMIRRYVAGQRRVYANPFAYLLLGTAFSVLVQKATGFQEWAFERNPWMAEPSPVQLALSHDLHELILAYLLWISLGILVPFAVLLRLLFRRVGFNVAELMVFALYTGGHVALLGVVTLPTSQLLEVHPMLLGLPIALAYMGWAAVGFFGGRVWTVVKCLVAYLVSFALYMGVAMAAGVVFALFFMTPRYQAIDEWSLVSAAEQGQAGVVQRLLEEGADPASTLDETALHVAARRGDREVIDVLLAHGADPDVRDHLGRTPAFLAVRADQPATARYLVEAGADGCAVATDGTTLLIVAAWRGHGELARTLVDSGCDVNAVRTDHTTVTALQRAARSGHADVVRLLLDHGADPAIVNAEGETALDLARSDEIAAMLRPAMARSTGQPPSRAESAAEPGASTE